MKKLSFKNLSVLGLILMGVSAITAAMTPAKSDAAPSRFDGNGEEFESSAGGGVTVRFVDGGSRSWTQTEPVANINGNGFSATSANDNGTLTQSGVAVDTAGGTSVN
jgi:hypothetical protein